MAKGDHEVDFDVPEIINYYLTLAARTYEQMWMAVEERNSMVELNEEQENYNEMLKRLFFAYEPKFAYSRKVDLPEWAENKDAWEFIDNLSFDKKMKLTRKIRDLQEAIGHTKYARVQHSDSGVGEKKGGK